MAFDITGIGTLVESITGIIEHFTTNKTEEDKNKLTLALAKLQAEIQTQQREADLLIHQLEINKAEASNPHFFVSGWRPAASWVCILGMLYSFVLFPILTWFSILNGLTAPPDTNTEILTGILLALLGLRTYEKKQGIDTTFNLKYPVKESQNGAINSIGIDVK